MGMMGKFGILSEFSFFGSMQIRMKQHHANSLALAEFLESHPCVEGVMHPLLPSHPDHALALRQNGGIHSGIFLSLIHI